jgi:ribosome-binding factor A
MGTYRQNRTAEDIRREIAAIVRELKDPRISDHLISVARAEVSSDSSYVKVYVSAVEGMEVAKGAAKALTGATGLVRREVGKRLGLRKTPEIKFVADDSIEHGMSIVKKLEEISKSSSEE